MAKVPTDLSGRQDEPYARAVVPDHRQIRPGTLRKILSQIDMRLDEFLELLWRPAL